MAENDTNDTPWTRAVQEGPESQSFDVVRKLTALSIVDQNPDISGGEAAAQADRSWFKKFISFIVEIGDMNVKDAIHRWIDRAHASAVAFTENVLPKLVNAGCTWIGRTVGGYLFGPVGAANGAALGAKIGGVLNEDVKVLARKGLDKLRDVAHRLWNQAKSWLIEKGQEAKQNVLNRVKATLA